MKISGKSFAIRLPVVKSFSVPLLVAGTLFFIFYFCFPSVDSTRVYHIFQFVPPTSFGVKFDGIGFFTLLTFLVEYLIFIAFGYLLVGDFFSDLRAPLLAKLVASFCIGYCCSIGLIRIITLLVSKSLVILVLLATMGWILKAANRLPKDIRTPGEALRKVRAQLSPSDIWVGLFAVSVFFLFLVVQIFAADLRWVGHGPTHYAGVFDQWRKFHFFPLVKQHIDEFLFTHVLALPFPGGRFDTLVPMWLTLALNKVSILFLVWCLFRKLGLKVWAASLSALGWEFGTTALNPTKYTLLFDQCNPAYYSFHSGRMIGVAMILLWMTDLFSAKGAKLTRVFFILAGLGLATTSISNSLNLFLIVPFFIFIAILTQKREIKISDGAALVFCAALILFCPLTYEYVGTGRFGKWEGWPLMATFLMGSLFWFAIVFNVLRTKAGFRKIVTDVRARQFYRFFLASLVALVFFVNLFCHNAITEFIVRLLQNTSYYSELRLWGLYYDYDPKQAVRFFADARERGSYSEYDLNGMFFLTYYGLLIVIPLFALLIKRAKKVRAATAETLLDHRLWLALLLCATLIPLYLFHMDFVTNSARAWFKSRFLEVPVYTLLFCFLALVFRTGGWVTRSVVAALILVHSLLPIYTTDRLRQWSENGKMMRELIETRK